MNDNQYKNLVSIINTWFVLTIIYITICSMIIITQFK